jgi:hypothetical protein
MSPNRVPVCANVEGGEAVPSFSLSTLKYLRIVVFHKYPQSKKGRDRD